MNMEAKIQLNALLFGGFLGSFPPFVGKMRKSTIKSLIWISAFRQNACNFAVRKKMIGKNRMVENQ